MNRTDLRLATLTVVSLLAAATPGLAQKKKDLRDEVELANGKIVRGRVVERFDEETLTVLQGGKRVRIAKKKIKAIRSLNDKLTEFLDRRLDAGMRVKSHVVLTEWAESHGLESMADLEALRVLHLDPQNEFAHEHLGHRRTKRGWLWKVGSRWLTREKYEERIADIGHPLVLESEHFRIETDAGMPRTIELLVDLEKLYLALFAEYGQPLQMREATRKMDLRIWNDADDFPGLSTSNRPYLMPNPYADKSFTYYAGAADRPVGVFALATEHVLNRCVARDTDPGGPRQRLCDWAELGFGQWIQSRLYGAPGELTIGEPRLDLQVASTVVRSRKFRLPNVLGLNVQDHFYGVGTLIRGSSARYGASTEHWARVHMFVHFLMDPKHGQENPARFVEYMRLALAEQKGASSSSFDKALKTRIETFEKPWYRWLESNTGGARHGG